LSVAVLLDHLDICSHFCYKSISDEDVSFRLHVMIYHLSPLQAATAAYSIATAVHACASVLSCHKAQSPAVAPPGLKCLVGCSIWRRQVSHVQQTQLGFANRDFSHYSKRALPARIAMDVFNDAVQH
jgi:hypothetical protein